MHTVGAGKTALKEKTEHQPFYLWFLSGPQCFILFALGLILSFLGSAMSARLEKAG
ncbi:MAG: hypothetical protein AB9903_26490 [Vulcanimicrobiota bacterium]